MSPLNIEFNLYDIYTTPEKYSELLDYPGYLIYKITNVINNKSYIGDTKLNLRWRLFDHWVGSHFSRYEDKSCNTHLYNSMRKYGLKNFNISIISTDLNLTESYFIDKFNSFYDGYNESMSGLPFHKGSAVEGKIFIRKDSESKLIKSNELSYWESLGWRLGNLTEDRIWINKDSKSLMITKDELEDYLISGWNIGRGYATNLNMIWVNKNLEAKMIPESELDYHLSIGYSIGKGYSEKLGTVLINNGVSYKYVNSNDLDSYISKGWVKGLIQNSKKIWIVNSENDRLKITESEIIKYHKKGYAHGRNWETASYFTDDPDYKYLFE